jgi:hypothetical protein
VEKVVSDRFYNILLSLKPQFAKSAQQVYDNWKQNGKHTGGICPEIAHQIMTEIKKCVPNSISGDFRAGRGSSHMQVRTTIEPQDEAHPWKKRVGFVIDIPYELYEIKHSYCPRSSTGYFEKKLGAKFQPDMVKIERVTSNNLPSWNWWED